MKTILCSSLFLFICTTLQVGADEWKPGTPSKDWPHVIASEEPGHYVPAPGWRFVSDAPDDFTVEQLPARDVVLPTYSSEVKISAPKGFWTLGVDDPIGEILKAEAEADKGNKTMAVWVKTENGTWNDVWQAAVKVPNKFVGKCMSMSAFAICRKTVREEMSDIERQANVEISKMAAEMSQKATMIAETNINLSVGGIRYLPPHLDEQDRLGFTLIRTDKNDVGGERKVSYGVNSCAMVWIRGAVAYLWVAGHAEKETDVDVVVKATRGIVDQWLADINTGNNRASLDAEDAIARANPNCIDPDKERKSKRESSSIWTRVIVWTIIGGIWGLVSTFFKKKKSE